MLAMVASATWAEKLFPWGQKVGATLLIIAFGALASNLGVVPATSPLYDIVSGPVTSLAIVWLLLGLRLGDQWWPGLQAFNNGDDFELRRRDNRAAGQV